MTHVKDRFVTHSLRNTTPASALRLAMGVALLAAMRGDDDQRFPGAGSA